MALLELHFSLQPPEKGPFDFPHNLQATIPNVDFFLCFLSALLCSFLKSLDFCLKPCCFHASAIWIYPIFYLDGVSPKDLIQGLECDLCVWE